MPYTNKAESERDRWMTLPEAVAQVRAADRCDENTAHQQIVKALVDGVRVLGPLRWEGEKGDKPPPFGNTPAVAPTDTPPVGSDWLTARIRWKTGRVRDDWSEHKNGKWRVLLILCSKVEQHWPLTPMASAGKAPVVKLREQKKKPRAKPEVDRAARALKVLYPDDKIPDQPSVHNKALLGMVNDCLASMTPALRSVKIDSCMRAAKRR